MDRFECLACGPVASRDPYSPFCPGCGEPLFLATVPRSGGRTIHEDRQLALERFADFLPLDGIDPGLSLGEGATPLIRLDRTGAALGLSAIYAKNEAQNPTGSFKDRGTAVAVQKAVSLGFKRIGTVSTGNMAVSTAAYGARAGLETFVLLKEGTAVTSLKAAGIHGPRLIAVEGDYGNLFRASLAAGKRLGISFMNSIDPYRMEGYKLTAYEIYLQLGRRSPRSLFVPLSSGGHLLGLMRAFEDLERDKLITTYPTFVGVQAQGCAPLATAFAAGRDRYERPTDVRTIAHAISNPTPPAGNAVLRMIRAHKGILLAVTDEEMLEAQRELAAAEGLFCQPESATTLAALKKLASSGRTTDTSGDAVLILTGTGLKTPHLLESVPVEVHKIPLSGLESCLSSLIH
ncbi:MAG: threonine synthase [Candidatus Aminicenantes bacterium]|nr:threonine synthase [Candidatus Aminicenantes bacterium]